MKKEYKPLLLLTLIYIILIILITKFEFIFGSNTDWIRQHAIIPEYFRNLFYETGNIMPNFAPHLGGGQNIFYYAYYGYLSPIILFSYLLPFIKMSNYIMVSTIIITLISIYLLYHFLKKNNFNTSISFILTLLYMLSTSIIFHTHRHIMFINYMPFLLLALLSVLKYFNNHKSLPLILNVTLMILTSFYFSIPGIIVICLYALYYYIKENNNSTFKEIFKEAIYFVIRILLGILLSSFLILPVFYCLATGRISTNSILLTNLIPSVNITSLMYGTYGVGLTSILWISLIYHLFYSKKENRILTIFFVIISCIPLFNLILNGGLYTNGKCFIPFIILYLLLIGNMLNDLKLKKLSLFIIIPIILSFIILKAASNYKIYFIIDLLITILFLYIYSKNKKIIYLTPIIIIAFIAFIITNKSDKLVTITDYKTILENKSYDIENYINLDSSIYRTEDYLNGSYNINYSKAKNDYRITSYSSTTNPFYTKAFYNTFNNNDIYRNKFMLDETNNLFFEKFMGIKYLLTDKDAPYGYKKVVEYNNGTLYENNNVYPIGYATSHILNQEEYNNLEFNAQLEAFLNNIIVDDTSSNAKTDTESKKINLSYQIDSVNNLTYESNNDTYNIISKDNGNIKLKLDEEITDHILIIRFKINKAPSCKDGDIAITINNITNKLTCKTWKYYNDNETFDYVISSNDSIKELNIEFLKGTYQISDIAIYEIPKSFFDETNDIDTLNIDWNNTKGDDLSGNITVNDDGYFIFTIPYDKGFTIKVDGIDTPYTMVNDAFIGFKINKGTHNIKISYRSPLFKEGKIISLVAIILIAILTIYEKKRYN